MAEFTITGRARLEVLRAAMTNERQSFLSHWRQLSNYYLPRRPMFTLTDNNKGNRRNSMILDSTGALAARTLKAGFMGGITSPARPWFKLTTPDPELAKFTPVKDWLHDVTERMQTVFLRSNIYNALPLVYGDLGVFGTSSMFLEEDFDNVIHCSVIPLGSYMIANDSKGRVRVFFRELRLTVRQIIQKFGRPDGSGKILWDNFSQSVQTAHANGNLDTWIDVCHVIQPNEDYNPYGFLPNTKKFRSIYYEKGKMGKQGSYNANDKFLRDSGYDNFPVLCPRWELTGEDVYGSDCPGMTALGEIKSLQVMKKRKAQATEKKVNPAMAAPESLRNKQASILPGDITYYDQRTGWEGFKPVHDVNFDTSELREDINEEQAVVKKAFFEDLFLMLANLSGVQPRNMLEISERKSEKLLVLGATLEQLNGDLLDPTIDNTFDIMDKQDLLPPPPEELQGMKLKVEYISIMHQAQKITGLGGIERLADFAGRLSETKPEILDKIDGDQMIDEYAEIVGVSPKIIKSDDDVEALRIARSEQIKKEDQQESIESGAKSMKDLAGANLDNKNMLTAMADASVAGV